MRITIIVLLAVLLPASLSARIDPRYEYGQASDLYSAKSVYLWTDGNETVAEEVRRQLAAALPALLMAEMESEADVTLSILRVPSAAAGEKEGGDESGPPTEMRVARGRGRTIRLYADAASVHPSLEAAVAEVLAPFILLMKEANPKRYGVAERKGPNARKGVKPRVHSTVGLRAGLSKREVLTVLGRPSRIDGQGARTQIWTYMTTDGRMRLVFAGDQLISVNLEE